MIEPMLLPVPLCDAAPTDLDLRMPERSECGTVNVRESRPAAAGKPGPRARHYGLHDVGARILASDRVAVIPAQAGSSIRADLFDAVQDL